MTLTVQLKIIVAFIVVIGITVGVNTFVFRSQSSQWFVEDAQAQLSTGSNIVNAELNIIREGQKELVHNLGLSYGVNSNLLMVNDLLLEESSEKFDDAYVDMGRSISSLMQRAGETSRSAQLLIFNSQDKLVAFFDKQTGLSGWLVGQGLYQIDSASGVEESEQLPEYINLVKDSSIAYDDHNTIVMKDMLSLLYKVEVFDVDDPEVKIGSIISNVLLIEEFAQKISSLSNVGVNFYIGNKFSRGNLPSLEEIESETYAELISSQKSHTNITHIQAQKYYSKYIPLMHKKETVGAVATLISAHDSEQRMSHANEILLFVSAASILVGAVIAYFFANTLTHPIRKLVQVATEVESGGDFSLRGELTNSDEVGRTVKAFNSLMDTLQTNITAISSVMEQFAQGDLTARVSTEATGDLQNLIILINESFDSVEKAMAGISISNQSLSQNINEASSASNTVKQNASDQVAAIDHVATSLKQSSEAISEVTKNTDNANSNARKAVSLVGAGQEKLLTMMNVVKLINSNSQKINSNVDSIQTIAEQTNLLALNAAIEAARAGEQGRGFAVVADEVRTLAGNASKAAEQITSLVKEAVEISANGVKTADEASQDMSSINEAVSETEQMLLLIASSMEQQDKTVMGISNNVETVRLSSQHSSKAAISISTIFESIESIADENRSCIDQFKTRDHS